MTTRHLSGLIALLVFTASPVWAAPIALGDFSGATVEFINVVADDGTLVGPATLNGDSLEFTPRISTGSSGGATQTIDNIVTFGLTALPGFAITDFQTSESGFRSLSGNGPDAHHYAQQSDGRSHHRRS